jgi:putative Holliday junction resolvase
VKRFGAVDYGRRRVGLAVSDPLGLTVRGLDTLFRERPGSAEAALRATAEVVSRRLRAEGVERVVVGLPVHADGAPSPMSEEARRFGALLHEASGLAVEYVDEGLTSWEAEEALRARGICRREAARRGLVDREAACLLLRGHLSDRGAD